MKLTLAEIKAAGLAAYHAGQLSAQGPEPACLYRDGAGRPCVIGAAMPEAFLDTDPEEDSFWGKSISDLVDDEYVEMDLEELPAARRLQAIHDRWAQIENYTIEPDEPCRLLPELQGLTIDDLKALLVAELTA